MSVSVDAARDDELAGGVDGAGAPGDPIQVLTHRLDHPETERVEPFETLFTQINFYPGQRRRTWSSKSPEAVVAEGRNR